MNGLKNTDYLRFLFHRAKTDLTRYELSNSNRELINNLFNRLSYSENLLKIFTYFHKSGNYTISADTLYSF